MKRPRSEARGQVEAWLVPGARDLDQLAVRLRHLAVRQVEVVFEAAADVAAEHQGGDPVPVEGRAFAAKMIPPGQPASGFFYFRARYRRGAFLYVNGVREGNKELFFSEIPLDTPPA